MILCTTAPFRSTLWPLSYFKSIVHVNTSFTYYRRIMCAPSTLAWSSQGLYSTKWLLKSTPCTENTVIVPPDKSSSASHFCSLCPCPEACFGQRPYVLMCTVIAMHSITANSRANSICFSQYFGHFLALSQCAVQCFLRSCWNMMYIVLYICGSWRSITPHFTAVPYQRSRLTEFKWAGLQLIGCEDEVRHSFTCWTLPWAGGASLFLILIDIALTQSLLVCV